MNNETIKQLERLRNVILNQIRRERYRQDDAYREKVRQRALRNYYRRKQRDNDSQESS